MEKAKNEAGQRLDAVIIKYFGTQKMLADLIGVTQANLSGYISGRNNITKKLAMLMQSKAGVNADFLLNGNAPMMLDTSRKPIFDGSVPSVEKMNTKTQHGIIKQYILHDNRQKQRLTENGEASIVHLILDNLTDPVPFMVLQISQIFAERYKISIGSIMVIRENYIDEDVVLYTKNNQYFLGIYTEGCVVEFSTKIPENSTDVSVVGSVIKKIENII